MHEMLKPKRGESILDLGCGTGRLTMQLASLVGDSGRVVGVDPDPCRIAVAKEQLTKTNVDVPVVFRLGSIYEAVRFGQFDGIFSNYVFHWFERTERAEMMQKMYDCLKPGGRLTFLLEPHQPQRKFIIRDAVRLAMPTVDEEYASGMKMDPPSVWLQHCSTAGFAVELSQVVEINEVEQTLEKLLQVVEAAIPNFKSNMLQDNDLQTLKNRYKSGNGDEVVHTITLLKVSARKPLTP